MNDDIIPDLLPPLDQAVPRPPRYRGRRGQVRSRKWLDEQKAIESGGDIVPPLDQAVPRPRPDFVQPDVVAE